MSAAILSRYFDKRDYGTYKQIVYVYNTLLLIFTAGLPRVFSYFLPKYPIEEGQSIVWKISKVLLLSGLLFSLFLFIFSDIIGTVLNNEELGYALKIFSPIPIFLLPTLGIEGIFSTYKKTVYIAIYNTISRLLMLLFIVVPVIVFKGDYITAIRGWLVVSIITFVMAYFFKNKPFRNVDNPIRTTLKYKQIFSYSLPLVVASLWGIAIKSADQFYVSRFFGVEVFAEFSNGFIELPFVGMITAATSTVLMPVFSGMIHHKTDINEVARIWRSALTKSIYIIYPIVVFSIINATNIMELLYSKIYASSSIYFQLCMILNFFNIIIFAPLIFALNETKFYARLHFYMAILAWGLGYFVVVIFNSPIAIAVLSVTLSITKILIAFNFISKKINIGIAQLLPVKYSIKVFAHSCICALLSIYLINLLISKDTILLQLSLRFFLYISLVLATSKPLKLDYLHAVRPLLSKLIKKKA